MIEINLNKVVKHYGFNNVLDGIDLEIKTGERVALIGANGSGKTTIFRIISDLESPTSGKVSIRKGATIGVLNQIVHEVVDTYTVRDILNVGINNLIEMKEKISEYEAQMTDCDDSNMLNGIIKKYSKLQEKFLELGGYEIDSKVNKVCDGFKISKDMLERRFNSLSGGEKTVISLASLVLSNPSILLLDEPTNHLDIDTLEWFEQFLSKYNGTVVIISHDRYFLDKVVTKTLLIEQGKIESFNGNYSYFLLENERRLFAEFESYKTQQKQIEEMRKTIKRLKDWGARGDNPKFFRAAASIEKRIEKLELLDKPDNKKTITVDFAINNRSGKDVLIIEELDLILGDKCIFKKASLKIRYGEKVALMGRNGSGKSTLIRSIINSKDIVSGNIKIGSNVEIGYIPQDIIFGDNNKSVLEEARGYFDGSETDLRASLAKFLFFGELVFKKVGILSGGEKVRLKLFSMIQKRANLLILDEPTNHIDIETKEMLEEALIEYKGTLIFISHDRYFINKLAERILYIDNQKIIKYIGNYDYFKQQKNKK